MKRASLLMVPVLCATLACCGNSNNPATQQDTVAPEQPAIEQPAPAQEQEQAQPADQAREAADNFVNAYKPDGDWLKYCTPKARKTIQKLLDTTDGNLLAQCSSCEIRNIEVKKLDLDGTDKAIAHIVVTKVDMDDANDVDTDDLQLSLTLNDGKWLVDDITDDEESLIY